MSESDMLPPILTPLAGRVSPRDLPDRLIAAGRYCLTSAHAQSLLGGTADSTYHALALLGRQRRLFSPARGFYVVIPPEYREWRSVPGDWFIDPMMRHLGRNYYVGLLTAAAFHGASHQAAQTFQVVTDKQVSDRDRGRIRLRFVSSQHVSEMAVEERTSMTGTYRLASRETTVVDLVWRQRLGGGISNVATVLIEIGDLDGDQIAHLAPVRGRSVARRLGWLLNRYRQDVDLHWLRVVAEPANGEPVLLVPGTRRGRVDAEWGVLVNTSVEPDV